MIDYRANVAALDDFRHALTNTIFAEPELAARRDEQIKSVDKAPDMALLGAMIGHLMWHAASDETELQLVERAAHLWRSGLTLYNLIGEVRSALESALCDPTHPDAVENFRRAVRARADIEALAIGKEAEVAILREDIYKAAHPGPHPRQVDAKVKQWTWADIFLARRTDAFAKELWARSSGDDAKAFAFGVISNYGANVCGSAYLGQVVGGPRRAHRHRDRLARNAVGSWFAKHYSSASSLAGLADRIGYGLFTPVLPAEIATLISQSLGKTYNLQRTPPLPDLQRGYQRMIRHLRALDAFVMPALPELPKEPLLTKIFGDTSKPSFSFVEAGHEAQAIVVSGGWGGGGGVKPQNGTKSAQLGAQDSKQNSKLDCGAFLEGLARWLVGEPFWFGMCWEAWAAGEDCKLWEDMKKNFADFWASLGGGQGAPSQAANVTAGGLTVASTNQQVVDLIHSLYDLHNLCWEALNNAFWYLSRHGLIYPDSLLDRKVIEVLLTIPPAASGWPHLCVDDTGEEAHLYPTTAVEQPAVFNMAYPAGSKPSVILTGIAAVGIAQVPTASSVSIKTWMQAMSGELDAQNYDLDSDRGIFHPCWSAAGSINDTPINVIALNYGET